MTFKELLNSVTFDEVAPCLLQMHPDAEGNLKWYKIHFDMFRLMTPKHHDDANADVCHISMSKWDEDSEPHLDAHPTLTLRSRLPMQRLRLVVFGIPHSMVL